MLFDIGLQFPISPARLQDCNAATICCGSKAFLPRDATQSAVLLRQFVHLSACAFVCLSISDVDVLWLLGWNNNNFYD